MHIQHCNLWTEGKEVSVFDYVCYVVFLSLLTFILVACSILLTAGDEGDLGIVPASVRVSDLRLLGTHPPPIRPLPPRLDY